ncbi:MAG: DUF4282 domain-containing protein [Candidatus Marinimicrobia bacterium]|nr:DUF4282 domain-containing protein [Candidatus Neomarinimicrobiota bacterium]
MTKINEKNLLDKNSGNSSRSGGGFFSFQKMISTSIIKFLYAIGAIVITIVGFTGIFSPSGGQGNPLINFLINLIIVVLGNLLWRILCEAWILLFSIHDMLGSINSKINNKS